MNVIYVDFGLFRFNPSAVSNSQSVHSKSAQVMSKSMYGTWLVRYYMYNIDVLQTNLACRICSKLNCTRASLLLNIIAIDMI